MIKYNKKEIKIAIKELLKAIDDNTVNDHAGEPIIYLQYIADELQKLKDYLKLL